eukprot:snap_masked-scaffold_29-processed-gene-2.52-mRNA-1 protein AED:1.00 eAED:1.00 QI:0/0/0/0/1/1/2/0/852
MNIKETITLPKLGSSKIIFNDWNSTYLGKKHLSSYILHDQQLPYFNQEKDTPVKVIEKHLNKLSIKEQVGETEILGYDKSSSDTPLHLIKLSTKSDILLYKNLLIPCYKDESAYLQARVDYASETQSVLHILRSSLANDLCHYIDSTKCIYEAYNNIKKHFKKDAETALLNARKRLTTINFRDLGSYINIFKKRLAEYHLYGGRNDKSVIEDFIKNIPDDKFFNQKSMCIVENLEDAINYFKKINNNIQLRCNQDKQRRYHKFVKVKQTQIKHHSQKPKHDSKIKEVCKKCGGFGHNARRCANRREVCITCGSSSHKTHNCNLKIIRVNKIQIPDNKSESSNPEDTKSNTSDNNSSEENSTHEFLSLKISLKNINVAENTCSCRFKSECIHALADSGATAHVTGNKDILTNIRQIHEVNIKGALSGTKIDTVMGDCTLLLLNHTTIKLKDVIYLPQLSPKTTIISESKLTDEDISIYRSKNEASLRKHDVKFATLQRKDNHYYLHCKVNPKNDIAVCSLQLSQNDLMHYRLAHLNPQLLQKQGVKPHSQSFCIGCCAGKFKQKKKKSKVDYSTSSLFQGKYPYEKIHIDTVGPLISSVRKFKYISLIVCNFSNMLHPLLLKRKSDLPKKLKHFLKKNKNIHKYKTRCIFSDRGTEFSKLDSYCQKHGIKREYSAVYFPSENGKIERQNQTVLSTIRAFLLQANISPIFWCYCTQHACKILNMLAKSKDISPYEILTSKKPPLQNVLLFGSRGYAITKSNKKLSGATPIIYLGNEDDSSNHLVLNMKKHSIERARTIKLDEIGTIETAYSKFISTTSKLPQKFKDFDLTKHIKKEGKRWTLRKRNLNDRYYIV